MKKQVTDLVRNYLQKLSEADLLWLHSRLTCCLGDDMAESLEFLSKTPEIDKWLSSAKSAIELYRMIDIIKSYISQDSRLHAITNH